MEQLGDLQKRYLKLLSEKYPTIASASTEIINLSAIMNLPKGTEHALSDIHGEADQFFHVLKNGSGAVRAKIDEEFGNSISIKDKKQLATLIVNVLSQNIPVPRSEKHCRRISLILLKNCSTNEKIF